MRRWKSPLKKILEEVGTERLLPLTFLIKTTPILPCSFFLNGWVSWLAIIYSDILCVCLKEMAGDSQDQIQVSSLQGIWFNIELQLIILIGFLLFSLLYCPSYICKKCVQFSLKLSRGVGGVGEILHWVRHLLCMRPTWIQTLVPHVVPFLLPGVSLSSYLKTSPEYFWCYSKTHTTAIVTEIIERPNPRPVGGDGHLIEVQGPPKLVFKSCIKKRWAVDYLVWT